MTERKIINGTSIIKKSFFGLFSKTFQEVIYQAKTAPVLKVRSFKNIFGDLSEFAFEGNLDLQYLALSSLEGIPKEIINGQLNLFNNPDLKNLDYFPEILSAGKHLYLDHHLTQFLQQKKINTYKDSIIYYSPHKDLSAKSKDIEKDIVLKFSEFRKVNKSFKKLNISYLCSDNIDFMRLEKLYQIYEKVGFDQEKFKRAIELI